MGNASANSSRRRSQLDPRLLAAIHPGFRESRSVVLHHYGTDPAYNAWRGTVPGQHGSILVRTSERNPPALFGAGLIDAIPDEAIEAAAKRKFPGSSAVKGRVSRLKDGRIGRFGWKAQTATLKEFVLSAAAGEMGLEVPGRRQAADPRLPGIVATGLDMDEAECDALTDYVRSLPTPIAIRPADDRESAQRQVRRGDLQVDRLRPVSSAEAGRSRRDLQRPAPARHEPGTRRTPTPTRCSRATRRGPRSPRPRTAPAPAPQRSRSGGRRPCGAFATPALICTMAGPRPSIRPSRCMPARVRLGAAIRGAFPPSQAAPRRVPRFTRRSAGEAMTAS